MVWCRKTNQHPRYSELTNKITSRVLRRKRTPSVYTIGDPWFLCRLIPKYLSEMWILLCLYARHSQNTVRNENNHLAPQKLKDHSNMTLLLVNICSRTQSVLKPTVRIAFELLAEQDPHFTQVFWNQST